MPTDKQQQLNKVTRKLKRLQRQCNEFPQCISDFTYLIDKQYDISWCIAYIICLAFEENDQLKTMEEELHLVLGTKLNFSQYTDTFSYIKTITEELNLDSPLHKHDVALALYYSPYSESFNSNVVMLNIYRTMMIYVRGMHKNTAKWDTTMVLCSTLLLHSKGSAEYLHRLQAKVEETDLTRNDLVWVLGIRWLIQFKPYTNYYASKGITAKHLDTLIVHLDKAILALIDKNNTNEEKETIVQHLYTEANLYDFNKLQLTLKCTSYEQLLTNARSCMKILKQQNEYNELNVTTQLLEQELEKANKKIRLQSSKLILKEKQLSQSKRDCMHYKNQAENTPYEPQTSNTELADTNVKLNNTVAQLKSHIENLNKQNEKLRDKLFMQEALTLALEKAPKDTTNNDTVEVILEDKGLTFEEMLKVVQPLKLVIIGGPVGFENKLKPYLPNMSVLCDRNSISNTLNIPPGVDGIILYWQRVGHKQTNQAKQIAARLDVPFIYTNTSNINQLVQLIYLKLLDTKE